MKQEKSGLVWVQMHIFVLINQSLYVQCYDHLKLRMKKETLRKDRDKRKRRKGKR